jgi:hypothetical protein
MVPKHFTASALALGCGLTLIACEAKKSANPLSPTVAGPIPGVEITQPRLIEPQQGFRVRESQQPVRLVIENSSSSGVRPLSYRFEVGADSDFQNVLFSRAGVPPGEGGRTTVQIDPLGLGRSYYWRARAEDGANTGPFMSAQFEVLPKPFLGLPSAISPVNNEKVTGRRPTLRIRNGDRNSAVGSLSYTFLIARDQAFTQPAAWATVPEEPGETSWTANVDLDFDLTYYWRVRATDGETTTDWFAPQDFRSSSAPAPAPAPPAPGPAPGGPCISSSAQAIVECERSKYRHMSSSQIVSFLRATARSLNANRISGGPFGILEKGSGNNCAGYSCDIICSGQGGSQRQWDVLRDAEGDQDPTWNGPHSGSSIRVDTCQIQ